MPLLEIQGLTKAFGGLRAINGLELHVDEGEVVSVIGPNGAGKTTFFNLVTGMETPDEGSIVFDGQDVVGLRPNQILKLGMARTFQNVRLFPAMTVLENVMVGQHSRTKAGLFGAIFKTPSQRREEVEIEERAKEVLSFFGTGWPATATTNSPWSSPMPTAVVSRSRGPWPPVRVFCFSMSQQQG